jgi:cyclopropane fatty-acyl-phospholipid synthase-like methyltransferase
MRPSALVLVASLALAASAPRAESLQAAQAQTPLRKPDIFWVPTPDPVVEGMLKLANVTRNDVVYDLGCGDGKIVIMAAQKFGARGVGIDIDPVRIQESNANAAKAGVADRVKFVLGDLFDPAVTIGDATVVTLYLLPSLNDKLQPRLKADLKPGTRIVSHSFAMTDWKEEKYQEINGSPIYFWTVPKR